MRDLQRFLICGLLLASLAPVPALAQEEAPALSEAAKSCFLQMDALYQTGDAAGVVQACSKAIEEQPDHTILLAELFAVRGIAYREQGAFTAALADLDRSLDLNPGSISNANMRAWTYREMGDLQGAENAYSEILQSDALKGEPPETPTVWQAYLSRCVVRQDQRNYVDALADCKVALQGSRNRDSLYFAAKASTELGNCTEAILLLEEALLLESIRSRVFEELGYAHDCAGERERALAIVDEGLAHFPGDESLLALQRELSQ